MITEHIFVLFNICRFLNFIPLKEVLISITFWLLGRKKLVNSESALAAPTQHLLVIFVDGCNRNRRDSLKNSTDAHCAQCQNLISTSAKCRKLPKPSELEGFFAIWSNFNNGN